MKNLKAYKEHGYKYMVVQTNMKGEVIDSFGKKYKPKERDTAWGIVEEILTLNQAVKKYPNEFYL
jgi:hypothetical protein